MRFPSNLNQEVQAVSGQVTSIYLLPIWCLCLCRAKSRCSSLTKRTRASPFLLPWALRHSAAPPLCNTTCGWLKVHSSSQSVISYTIVAVEKTCADVHTWRCWGLWRTERCPGLMTAKATLWLWSLCCHTLSPAYCCTNKQTNKHMNNNRSGLWGKSRGNK